ncbi:helix-turn-helix domain-containing protein [Streptomyces rimosus]|uniref:helix-turn-helix domain-containing protein n=1 Tax=Streptomyces rimosus TaxID=1927 RepID=UPI000AB5A59E|nr:helix-turn-helix transcriptional regulator [Streptomyces rimosus]
MAPRTQPTERQRRLGAELRKLRLAAGLSGDQAAAVIDADRQRVSHIESGRVDVPRNGLYNLLRSYGCAEGPLFEGLMAMAQLGGRGGGTSTAT